MTVPLRPAALAALATLVLIVAQPASQASAQSFFQTLFGFGSAPSGQQQRPGGPASVDRHYRQPVSPPARFTPDTDDNQVRRQSSGRFRTLCVRMCDGYYFPINAAVSRREFYRDASQCRSQCGTEARLFYHSSTSGDAAAMIDVTGRAYAKLPNAFRYRKTLVDGCKCKHEPWAESELDRHQNYAIAEAAKSDMATASAVKSIGIAAVVVAGQGKAPIVLGPPAPSLPAATPYSASVMVAEPIAGASASPVTAVEVAGGTARRETSEAGNNDVAASLAVSPATLKARKLRVQSNGSQRAAPPVARTTVAHTPRPASRPTVAAASRPKPAPAGIFGLGGQKLKWPGD